MKRLVDNLFTFVLVIVSLMISVQSVRAEDPPVFTLTWGSPGSGDGQFSFPIGVAVDVSGNVYVVDSENNRIQKFTSDGTFLLKWGSSGSGDGQFMYPAGIAIDPANNVFVVDGQTGRIQKFSSDGTFLLKWGNSGEGDGQFHFPWGIATDQSGNVYVADESNERIQKFTNNGSYILQWGSFGLGDGKFRSPMGITVDSNGGVYVTDERNNRVQKFTSNGDFILKWGSGGTGNSNFNTPLSVTTDPNGFVYVADTRNNRVQKFSNNGSYILQWGTTGYGNGQFSSPYGVATGRNGNIYVTDDGNNRVQEFTLSTPDPIRRPIVFVHGYCGNAPEWNTMRAYFDALGYTTDAFDFIPNNDQPSVLAKQLADHLDQYFPGQDVDVIAHSMGGLVVRQYIRQRPTDSRIKNLITLGTPNHGVDLILQAFRMKTVSQWLKKTQPFNCLLSGNGVGDLLPGSVFLNNLNYDNPNLGDKSMNSSRGAHSAEIVYDPGVNMWAFAGTQTFIGPAYSLTVPAWASTRKWYTFGLDYLNDGVVGVDAAVMWNNISHSYIDTDLGISSVQHYSNSVCYPGLDRTFENAQNLYPFLEGILRGVPPVTKSDAVIAPHQAQAESDTVLSILLTDEGPLPWDQVTERSTVVPNTPMLRISMVAEFPYYEIRKPDGTLLTPDDTLTTPGLHYQQDSQWTLAIYTVDNPEPGTWSAVFDQTGVTQDDQYAVTFEVATTRSAKVETSSNVVYNSGTVQLRASLQQVGQPQPNTSWNVTVVRPDTTSYVLQMYDDGAHSDSLANDGIFSGSVPLDGAAGLYRIEAIATDLADSVSFNSVATVELAPYNDVAVDSVFVISRNMVSGGDSVTVLATVRNLGSSAVDSVVVELWDNHLKLNETTLSLGASQSAQVSLPWKVALPDTHSVEVVVNPFVLDDEVNYLNNSTRKTVILGQPVNAVEPEHGFRLSLAPPMPNPFRGSVALRFSLPTDQAATLTIYDLLGRRVRQWNWSKLPAGQHQVSWDGRSETGRNIPPSILFYRLDANGQHLKQKLIHLQ